MPTDQELIKIVPSSRQLAYQATEFYAFFHFGMNTYTNREWGDGTETPQIFNPTEFVADQWVSAAQKCRYERGNLPVNIMMVSACGRPDIPAIALSPVHGKMEGEMWSGKCLKHAVVMG